MLRELVHAFKFQRRRVLGVLLGRLLAASGDDVLRDAAAVVPVPLHPFRSLLRGFNQADDLAVQIGLPVWRLLRRTELGTPQAGLPAERRRRNLISAFAVRRRWVRAKDGRRLHGATVVLIDDVLTTGATLDACGAVLRAAGVSEVRALTVARAVATRPPRPPLPHPPSSPQR